MLKVGANADGEGKRGARGRGASYPPIWIILRHPGRSPSHR